MRHRFTDTSHRQKRKNFEEEAVVVNNNDINNADGKKWEWDREKQLKRMGVQAQTSERANQIGTHRAHTNRGKIAAKQSKKKAEKRIEYTSMG